jgi:hypothetical protein
MYQHVFYYIPYTQYLLGNQQQLPSLTHRIMFRNNPRGRIFSHVQPSYERAVSDLDKSMNISLWVYVAHSSFTEGSHTNKKYGLWIRNKVFRV